VHGVREDDVRGTGCQHGVSRVPGTRRPPGAGPLLAPIDARVLSSPIHSVPGRETGGTNVRRPAMYSRLIAAVALLSCPLPIRGQVPEAATSAWEQAVSEWRTTVSTEGIVGSSLALLRDGQVLDLHLRPCPSRDDIGHHKGFTECLGNQFIILCSQFE